MRHYLQGLLLVLSVFSLPLSGVAAVSADVASAVASGMESGASHEQIIGTLTSDPMNMTLEEAALAAMEAGGEQNIDSFASAAIASASNLPEAESVAAAVASAGASSAAVDAAMASYVKLMDQPFIHHDGNIPTGGGDYNPGPIIGGGTRPPVGGTRPPVSPDS